MHAVIPNARDQPRRLPAETINPLGQTFSTRNKRQKQNKRQKPGFHDNIRLNSFTHSVRRANLKKETHDRGPTTENLFCRKSKPPSALLAATMKVSFRLSLLILASGLAGGVTQAAAESAPNPDPERFAKSIAAFEKQDAQANKPNASPSRPLILFTGSSSIRMWTTLEQDFPRLHLLNRGFGGSHLSDVLHYFDVLVARHKPGVIVLYCGENDLWSGKPPTQVLADFREFVRRVHALDPATTIHYLACKPSPARFSKWKLYQKCNRSIARLCKENKRLNFIDVSTVMLDPENQKPNPEIWLKDNLHMNAKGYARWTRLLNPFLAK